MAYFELLDDRDDDRIIPITDDSFLIGRDEECDIRVNDVRISRRHAILQCSGGVARIEDLGSKNGIEVNGVPVSTVPLTSGDVVSVGPVQLKYRDEEPERGEPEALDRKTVSRMVANPPPELESHRRLRMLLDVAMAVDSLSSPERLLVRLGELVCGLYHPSRCFLAIDELRWSHDEAHPAERGKAEVEVDPSLTSRVREQGEALLFHDLEKAPLIQLDLSSTGETVHQPGREFLRAPACMRVRSAMAAPVLLGRDSLGMLYVDRKGRPNQRFARDDLALLVSVGRLIGSVYAGSMRCARLEAENHFLRASGSAAGTFIGESASMQELRKTIEERIAPVKATVLLMGETGTGKTMLAETIHLASPRREGPFVKVNCAAIPRELLESELFGHEKGAFTGAMDKKIGQFEAASGGTLFLDEVGELELAAQAKLLTIVQERLLQRVGSTKTIEVDARLITATNRDLKAETDAGRFRADLFYRLNVVRLEAPPLRERRDDIVLLARHLLSKASREIGRNIPDITPEALRLLECYQWPGNVRELANCMERAVIFGEEGKPLKPSHLPSEVRDSVSPKAHHSDRLERTEHQMILDALARSRGNKREAARLLGWYPQKLYSRLQKYNIKTGKG